MLEHIPSQTYPVTPYDPGEHLFNLHSWPLHETFNDPKLRVGSTILSNDLLHTTEFKAGYLYDWQKHTGETFAQLSYQGWYPVFTLKGNRTRDYQRLDTTQQGDLTVALPLTFKQGQYTNNVSLSTTSSLSNNAQARWFQQTYQGQVTRTAQQSCRDLYPPWEQKFKATYTHTPYRSDIQGHRICIQPEFYFPGLLKHHSFHVEFTYENTTHQNLYRWLPNPVSKHILGDYIPNIRRIAMNYALPIYYPDWQVGSLFYIKRLSVHTVYDFIYSKPTKGYPPTTVLKYNNVLGLILFADVNFWPLPVGTCKISAGCSYQLEASQEPLKSIFSVSFNL